MIPHHRSRVCVMICATFGLLILLLAGCGGAPEDTARAVVGDGMEAPALAELVAAGELPPLDERLPDNPYVPELIEGPGVYGGTLYTGLRGAADDFYLNISAMYDPLIRWNAQANGTIPGLAESVETSEDARVWTITLREGTRWSDGEPFTVDDLLFYTDHVIKHPELADAPPYLRGSGDWEAERIDDYTIRFTFEEPNAFFAVQMVTADGNDMVTYPAHYLEGFHQDFNSDADRVAREAGFADWATYFGIMNDSWNNPELPTLNAWVPTQSIGEATTQFVMERNPYYWKVDSEGRQLPYLDRVVYFLFDDPEPMVLRTLGGEVDFMARRINNLDNKAVFVDNQQIGGYDVVELQSGSSNWSALYFNQTTNDPVLRPVFRDIRFRRAMSHAINRQEIIDVVFVGQGEPWQISPQRGSGFFNEQLAKQYTEYDPDLANRLLDEVGLDRRDAEGWRIGPDGERFEFIVTTRADKVWMNDTMEMIIPMWRAVGVYAINRPVEKSFQRQLRNSNQIEVMIDDGESGWSDVLIRPQMHIPTDNDSAWGIAWYNWKFDLDGDQEEPLPWVAEGLDLYDRIQRTPDEAEQHRMMHEILQLAADNFPMMGICIPVGEYGIVNNRLRNVAETWNRGSRFAQPGAMDMSQFYFVDGSRK